MRYTGILPDLFREGQGVVTEGVLDTSGQFLADTVLAKHDENYMPPEVAKSLKEQGLWQRDGKARQGAEMTHRDRSGRIATKCHPRAMSRGSSAPHAPSARRMAGWSGQALTMTMSPDGE